ncbi:DUF2271 domain-containing protein [Stakelama saccharophila]|uniref:DUF2271 domain-containing protein n=1 Tax=Stakelama saccharophila TaxID=3075605 RepID=A0ABZ0B9J7_9SPHN|nr:DUF2271 domain-containing protein [Stakelama sp. W311]WNO54043.1 DUF2271 domain-containing protein [Stakelama sp. W311]
MRLTVSLIGTSLIATPAIAGDMTISITIPQLRVAEYHRPNVAVWIENGEGEVVADLATWYDLRNRREDGAKWLSDLRTWWRRSGRALDLPVDGVSGPTRAPGKHVLHFTEGHGPLHRLSAGPYRLLVEAAREVGGREKLAIPFTWPPKGNKAGTVRGESELGAVTLSIKP